jgi:hypothetical protein
MQKLYRLCWGIDARHVLLVADACYSGHLVPRSKRSHGALDAIQPRFEERSLEVIASAMRKQQAWEEKGQGVFTRQFVRALDGEAFHFEFLFAQHLASWIENQILASNRHKPENLQLTQYYPDGDGTFIFLRPDIASRRRIEAILGEFVSHGMFEVRLQDPANTSGRRRVGDRFHLHAWSEKSGYLYLLCVEASSTVNLLTPNFDCRECRIEAGTEIRLPDPQSILGKIRLYGAGDESYCAIVSSKPLGHLASSAADTSADSPYRTWPGTVAIDILESVKLQLFGPGGCWGAVRMRLVVD